MSARQQISFPELQVHASQERCAGTGSLHGRARRFLGQSIFVFLCLFAILLPHSIKGSQHAWQIALLLWLLTLAVSRTRPFRQPLAAPLLAYVVFSGISTLLSPDPIMSWDRMKIVCLVLVGIVVAQNLHRLRQVRTLVYLLILSGVAAAGFTAWQYTYGVGVTVAQMPTNAPLLSSHIVAGDIITRIDGRQVHTPAELEAIIRGSTPASFLRVEYMRGFPFHKKETFVAREQWMMSGFGTPGLQFERGKPTKAQGTLGHYVVFAEMLMQIGCMAWALLLAAKPQQRQLRLLLALGFITVTAALFMADTRAPLAGLALGGFISVLMLAGKKSRIWATATLAIMVLVALLWIRDTRGPNWLGTHDAGTSFRLMMWEDAPRLIGQHPWFGVGMETIRHHWMEWHIRAFTVFHDESHFHDDMIQIAVERGLLAAAAWLWFVVAYVVFLLRLIRRSRERSRFAAGVATGVLAGFAAYQLTALVHYDLGIESIAMILFFYYGIAVAMDRMLQTAGGFDVP